MEYQLAVLVEHSLKTGTILEMGITIPWNSIQCIQSNDKMGIIVS